MLFHNPDGAPLNLHCDTVNGRAVSFQCIVKLAENAQEIVCLGVILNLKAYFLNNLRGSENAYVTSYN